MKYNININQLVLSGYPKMDVFDGAILDYLQDICSSTNERIASKRKLLDGQLWTWVDLKSLIANMPLLRIKSIGAFSARFKKIKEAGFIETFREAHQKLYVRLTSEFDKLLINVNSYEKAIHEDEQLHEGAIHLNEQSYSFKSTNYTNIDNTNIDSTNPLTPKGGDGVSKQNKVLGNKDKVLSAEDNTKNKVSDNSKWKDYFDHYKAQSGEKRVVETVGRKTKFRARLKTFSLDELKQSVTNAFGDSFYSGNNDRGWRANLDYLLRNDEVVDRLIHLKVKTKNVIFKEE